MNSVEGRKRAETDLLRACGKRHCTGLWRHLHFLEGCRQEKAITLPRNFAPYKKGISSGMLKMAVAVATPANITNVK